MPVAAIAFTQAPAEQIPNLRANSRSDPMSVYFSMMECAFASVVRWRDDVRLCLVSDQPVPDTFAGRFDDLGVQTLLTEFDHRPPSDFFGSFNASLYTLDAMRALAEAFPEDAIALIDPDCLAVRPLAPLFADTATSIAAYPTGITPHEMSNGITGVQAAELHRVLDPDLVGAAEHFGGECYVFRSETIAPVLERAEAAYELTLKQHASGAVKFTTEEHLLNYALRRAEVSRLDDRLRRIWTAPRYREVTPDLEDMVIWHLPAEKDRGFVTLRPAVHDRSSWFWTGDPGTFRRELGRHFGIPRRPLKRWSYDTAGRAVRRLQGRVGPP